MAPEMEIVNRRRNEQARQNRNREIIQEEQPIQIRQNRQAIGDAPIIQYINGRTILGGPHCNEMFDYILTLISKVIPEDRMKVAFGMLHLNTENISLYMTGDQLNRLHDLLCDRRGPARAINLNPQDYENMPILDFINRVPDGISYFFLLKLGFPQCMNKRELDIGGCLTSLLCCFVNCWLYHQLPRGRTVSDITNIILIFSIEYILAKRNVSFHTLLNNEQFCHYVLHNNPTIHNLKGLHTFSYLGSNARQNNERANVHQHNERD